MFKKKSPPGTPMEQVQGHLQQMGYEIEEYGIVAAEKLLQTGLTPAEVASKMVYTTMAYDLKQADTSATASLRYRPVATGVLAVLDRLRDEGLMSEANHKHDYDLMIAINAINENQVACIEKVLSEPLMGSARLARNTGVLK